MQRGLLVLGVLFTVLALAACGGSDRGGLATFVGHWSGHTRGIDISRSGSGREYLGSGAAPVAKLTFKVLAVTGSATAAVAQIRVASVHIFDPSALGRRTSPRVGELGRLRLRHGVVTDSITRATFCAPKPAKMGICGL
jgi:hypothetical protein